jgi:hypothetical protein
MDDHSGQMRTASQTPPPPPVVQHRPVIIPNVSSPTRKAPPAMFNSDDYSSSDEVYIDPAGSITADDSAKWHKKTLQKPIQNLTYLPELPTFNPL